MHLILERIKSLEDEGSIGRGFVNIPSDLGSTDSGFMFLGIVLDGAQIGHDHGNDRSGLMVLAAAFTSSTLSAWSSEVDSGTEGEGINLREQKILGETR